jgi:hypothetical protein
MSPAYSYHNFIPQNLLPFNDYVNFVNEVNFMEYQYPYLSHKNTIQYYGLTHNTELYFYVINKDIGIP